MSDLADMRTDEDEDQLARCESDDQGAIYPREVERGNRFEEQRWQRSTKPANAPMPASAVSGMSLWLFIM